MLLIIAISRYDGGTVAALLQQQSYVIDKRITTRFIPMSAPIGDRHRHRIAGAAAMMAFCTAAFSGHPNLANSRTPERSAAGLGKYISPVRRSVLRIALIDAV